MKKYFAKKRFFSLFLISCCWVYTNFLVAQTGLGIKTVVIDPGHGGKDPGAIGVNKVYEKDIALDVALQLGDKIKKAYPDVKVVYTRSTDVFIGLAERARIANSIGADLFISLHANSAENKTAHGAETWVLGLHKSEAALKIAQKENASILMEDDREQTYADFDPNDPDAYIALSMRQNAFLNQSLTFADLIQKNIVGDLGRSDRGVKQAGFMVLYHATMPAVLVELGFLSYKEEADFLASKDGRSKMATELFDAFAAYKEKNDKVDKELKEGAVEGQQKPEPIKKEINEPKEPSRTENRTITYKVQFASGNSKIDPIPQNFKGLTDIEATKSGKMYIYTSGKFEDIKSAEQRLKQAKSLGYKSAYIIALHNGERISLKEAAERSGK